MLRKFNKKLISFHLQIIDNFLDKIKKDSAKKVAIGFMKINILATVAVASLSLLAFVAILVYWVFKGLVLENVSYTTVLIIFILVSFLGIKYLIILYKTVNQVYH